MLDIIKTIILGIVEGITEWLPISSTGHLIILETLLPMQIRPQVWSLFLVVIQLGAILAVVILFLYFFMCLTSVSKADASVSELA